jgi:hypothetical protein
MNRRGQRTGINLRLYRVNAKLWQRQILAPTYLSTSGFTHYLHLRLRSTLLFSLLLQDLSLAPSALWLKRTPRLTECAHYLLKTLDDPRNIFINERE